MKTQPPAGELELVNLRKLYLLTLLGRYFVNAGTCSANGEKVVEALRSSGLLTPESPLAGFFTRARQYMGKFFNLEWFEPNVHFNEMTGMPEGVGIKIAFREPTNDQAKGGAISISELLPNANVELDASDRLDVAFAESPDLEANALRALLRDQGIFPDASIDLIYLDPPFNSNADYNVLFREASGEASLAQFHAFTDTWNWADAAPTYTEFVDNCQSTAVVEMVEALHSFLKNSPMMK